MFNTKNDYMTISITQLVNATIYISLRQQHF